MARSQLVEHEDAGTQIVAASRARRVLDCGSVNGRSRIDADALREVCLGGASLDPFGIRIAGALVQGRLDLRGVALKVPLVFESCFFEEAPIIDGADLHELAILGDRTARSLERPDGGSRLPGLLANGLRLRRDLNLSGSVITGAHATTASMTRTSAIWLTEAEIGGRLLAVGTRIDATGDRAIQADRTRVAGDVRLVRGFLATGEVRLLKAQLGGSLDLTAASLLPRDGRAVDLSEASIGGSVFLLEDPDLTLRPRVHGRIEMGGVTIGGRLHIRNADLRAPSAGVGRHDYNGPEPIARVAVAASRLTVAGATAVEADSMIHGALVLSGAELKGGLNLERATVWNPDGVALDLSQAAVGIGLNLRGACVQGTVDMTNADLRGPVDLTDAELARPQRGRCLVAVNAKAAGDVLLTRLVGRDGGVNLRGSSLAGVVDAEGAVIHHPGGKTLSLHYARVAGNVRLCNGFASTGVVVLNRAVIEGRLRCDGGSFAWTVDDRTDSSELNLRGSAFEAISAVIRSGIGLGWRVTSGAVDLTNARTSFLADDPASDWPVRTYLSGFAYDEFAPLDMQHGRGEWDAGVRAHWLAGLRPYDPRPWEQVARVLRSNGDVWGAERILIAQRRHARRQRAGASGHGWHKYLDLLKDVTVRYGFRPHRAVLLVTVLIAAVAVSLGPASVRAHMVAAGSASTATAVVNANGGRTGARPGPCPGTGPCFHPVLYAIDTVVPIIDLKQRSTWQPDRSAGWLQWWLDISTIIGWAAFTVFALSFTRMGRV